MKRSSTFVHAIDLRHGAERIDVSPSPNRGGYTAYDRKTKRVIGLQLPTQDNAHARTVRLHEMIHAQRQGPPTKAKLTPGWQTVMDVRVHTVDWPEGLPEQAQRDAVCTALSDVRNIDPAMFGNANAWTTSLIMAVRAAAILQQCGSKKALALARNRFNKLFPEQLRTCLDRGLELAKGNKDQQKLAAELLDKLMNPPELPTEEGEPGAGPGSPEDFGKAEGEAPPYMKLVHLPLSEDCLPSPAWSNARSGMRINRNRLTRAVVNNSVGGLFRRLRPVSPQGTVLFDASGSMELDDDKLKALCLSAPGATIGYYSGNKDTGYLVVYAKDGRRYRCLEGEPLPHHDSGNAVDLPAVQWLLAQEGPRILVTDLGFCGGKEGDAKKALAQVVRAQALGELTVIGSVDEALARFSAEAN